MDKDTEILKLPISRPHIQAEAGLKIIGVTLLLSGFIFFLGFFYVAILSKLLPSSGNQILSAIQNDSLEENGTCSGVFPIGAINMHVLLPLGACHSSSSCDSCLFALAEHESLQACMR